MATELEDRLARMGDAVAPGDAATARARAAALDALPAPRRRRAWAHLLPRRRHLSVALAVFGTVAIAAVLVLSLPRGADRPVAAGITLVATSPTPGGAVDAADLATTAEMIDRRAKIMRIAGADAEVVDGDIVVRLPADAPPGALRELTARGEFAIYDSADIIGPPNGVPEHPRPKSGQRVIDSEDAQAGVTNHILILDRPALTDADVSAANIDDLSGEGPILQVSFTPAGRSAFHAVTRKVAQRGAVENTLWTVLIVIDDELVSNPTVDPNDFPDGINSGNLQVDAGPGAPAELRRALAAKIQEGPLPVVLTPAG